MKIDAPLHVHVPRHLSTAVTHPLCILVALRRLQHAWLPTLNYFPNILLFIASKYPVSYCVSCCGYCFLLASENNKMNSFTCIEY